jgi:hypothetical protein
MSTPVRSGPPETAPDPSLWLPEGNAMTIKRKTNASPCDVPAEVKLVDVLACQSASDRDPGSASKRAPPFLRFERLALAPSELVGVAETGRARVGV